MIRDEKMVTKSNDLIQMSRFSLNAQQQKIVLYIVGQINPWDEEFQYYKFRISEFCKCCGIDESGKNYRDIKDAIKAISDKSVWVTLEDGRETLLRWIEKTYIDTGNGEIDIRLDQDMVPFLLQLKENFTTYELFWTLRFRSKYSIRLYELISSIHYKKNEPYTRGYALEDLKRRMGAEGYDTYQNFKARALDTACREINEGSNKNVSYRPVKRGKKVVGIELTVSEKDTDELVKTRIQVNPEEAEEWQSILR